MTLVEPASCLWSAVLLDPDRFARLAIGALLSGSGLRIESSTDDPVAAVRHCRVSTVGVLISEITIPGTAFDALIAEVTERRPTLRVVVLTAEEDPGHLVRAVTAGACAVLSKFSDPAATVARISATTRGGLLLDEITAPAVMKRSDQPAPVQLSERERTVLSLIGQGRTMYAVGRELALSESTVKNHAAKAAARLGAVSSRDAARRAARLGLLGGVLALVDKLSTLLGVLDSPGPVAF